jgi:hypothetical protein
MKANIKIIYILVLVIIPAAFSCKKLDSFPPEPEIQYIGFQTFYNPVDSIFDRGVLAFYFTDGDGDLGLAKNDTFPPFNYGSEYYFNLIVTFFEIQDGVKTKVDLTFYNQVTQQFDTITQNARIPILTPSGANKSISGEIYDTLFIYNYNSDYDTLMFDAYIIDRALNESNVIITDTIIRK